MKLSYAVVGLSLLFTACGDVMEAWQDAGSVYERGPRAFALAAAPQRCIAPYDPQNLFWWQLGCAPTNAIVPWAVAEIGSASGVQGKSIQTSASLVIFTGGDDWGLRLVFMDSNWNELAAYTSIPGTKYQDVRITIGPVKPPANATIVALYPFLRSGTGGAYLKYPIAAPE
jgi:hypothetical protein